MPNGGHKAPVKPANLTEITFLRKKEKTRTNQKRKKKLATFLATFGAKRSRDKRPHAHSKTSFISDKETTPPPQRPQKQAFHPCRIPVSLRVSL